MTDDKALVGIQIIAEETDEGGRVCLCLQGENDENLFVIAMPAEKATALAMEIMTACAHLEGKTVVAAQASDESH